MKEALISPNEPRVTGYRIAQIVNEGQTFEVGSPMFWTPCADNIIADEFWYDPTDSSIQPLPTSIFSITNQDLTAIVQTCINHNLKSNDQVVLSNQVPLIYSGTYNIIVIDEMSFSYTLNELPESSATEVGSYTINY